MTNTSFSCPIAFCKVTSAIEPYISCFGPCQGKFHVICLGIPEVCIDMFRDPLSGFKYICSKCRDISIASISNEIKLMEMHFSSLKTKFLSLLKGSSEARDQLILDGSSNVGLSVKRNAKDMDELTVSVSKKVSAVGLNTTVKEVASTLISPAEPMPASLESVEATSLPDAANPLNPTPLTAGESSFNVDLPSVSESVGSPLVIAGNPSNNGGLTAVPKPVSVFVSRLAPETTVDQVSAHISLKLGDRTMAKVKKLTGKNRPVSSFKIDVSRDLVHSILRREIWPDGAFVGIFEDRSNSNITRKKRLNNRRISTNRDDSNNAPSNVIVSKN